MYQMKKGGSSKKPKMAKGGSFPDLTGDGKVTRADVLKGRGVFKKGGTVKSIKKMKIGGPTEGKPVIKGIKSAMKKAYMDDKIRKPYMTEANEERMQEERRKQYLNKIDSERTREYLNKWKEGANKNSNYNNYKKGGSVGKSKKK